jgi:hypothetical protein
MKRRLAESLIQLGREQEAIPILEEMLDYLEAHPELPGEERAKDPDSMLGYYERHLIAYGMFKTGQSQEVNEDWLIKSANLQYERFFDHSLPQKTKDEIVKELHKIKWYADLTLKRVIEYFESQGDKEAVRLWNERLKEIWQIEVPYQVPAGDKDKLP